MVECEHCNNEVDGGDVIKWNRDFICLDCYTGMIDHAKDEYEDRQIEEYLNR